MQGLGNRKKVVDFKAELTGDIGQLDMTSISRRSQGLDEPADAIGRDLRQNLRQSSMDSALRADRLRYA